MGLKQDIKNLPARARRSGIPTGWKTAEQLAAEEGMAKRTANTLLRKLVLSGSWQVDYCAQPNICGTLFPTPIYRKCPSTKPKPKSKI